MAKDLIIYDPSGRGQVIESLANTTHVESAQQQTDGQNSDVVNVTIRSAVPVDYQIGSYINVYGRRYWLNQKGTIRKASESDFSCTFKFEGVQYQLARSSYDLNLDPTHTGADLRIDSLTADLKRFVEVLILSSQEATPGLFTLGQMPQNTEEKTISFSDEDNCLSALQRLCQEYDTFFTFTPDKTGASYALNIGQEGDLFPYAFKYGVGRGIYVLERANVDEGNIINRLKVRGSSQNIISSRYRDTELLLPGQTRKTSYIEDLTSIAKYGMWVGVKTFDDIYPHRTGTVSAAGDNYYSFKDSGMDFDLNATDGSGKTLYLIEGEAAKVHFNTGQLAGYEFDVVSYDHNTKTFVLKPYDTETGYRLPNPDNKAFQIGKGDKYVLLNIFMPQSYVDKAENELLEAARAYLKQESTPAVKYSLNLSEFFLRSYMNEDPDQNIFEIGDLIHITDKDLAIDADIKITGITRDLLNPYNYGLTIADEITTTTVGTTIINDLKDIDRTLRMNNLFDAARARRNWKDQQELLSMIFDPDGYFTDAIRPLSIETSMLSVGAKSMQFGLVDTIFEPNYAGDPNRFVVSTGGSLVHYTIDENVAKTWQMAKLDKTITEAASGKTVNTTPFYIYAVCDKNGSNGRFLLSTETHDVNDSLYYYFLVGVLNSVDSQTNTRSISLTYGFTTVNGRFIKTGRIQSADGVTYFDLDAGEIGGRIVFTRNDAQMTIDDLAKESLSAKDYIDNTLPGLLGDIQAQLDGQIEQWFYNYDPTDDTEPTSDWTTTADKETHLGDLFYNTDTGKVWRYVKVQGPRAQGRPITFRYVWQQLSNEETAAALAAANDALALAKTKRRVFTSTPYPPYEVGDLWVQGASGDIMRCVAARDTGSYTASDWSKASKYTDDSALMTFVNGVFAKTITNLSDQIDGKIESWFQATDPSSAWNSSQIKSHEGDMWYNTKDKTLWRYVVTAKTSGSTTTYSGAWNQIQDATALAAYDAASKAQDTADGKRTVFLTTPKTPYYAGDLWTDGNDLKRCITTRETGSYVAADWGMATNYDNTQTVIDGGIVTAGTVQLAGSSGSILAGITGEGTANTSVRFWAGATKENRAIAPFRVLQDGTTYATKLHISGESTFEGKMNAVEGSFKALNCVNDSGEVVGSIRFGSDGNMWLEGDLYNQGYDNKKGRGYRFYSSDIWCRGMFGACERNVVKIVNNVAYYYSKGYDKSPTLRTLLAQTSNNKETFYRIPCYGDTGDYSGMPIDVIVFCNTSSSVTRYELTLGQTQRVLVINANDNYNNIEIYQNGSKRMWNGGEMAEVINMSNFMIPSPGSSVLGRGLMIGAFRNNDWR